MKIAFAAVLCLGLLAAPQLRAVDVTYYVFKASAVFPVTRLDSPADITKPESIVTKSFNSNDLVNLALGRELGSKVDAKSEVLAVAVSFQSGSGAPIANPHIQLIIFDPVTGGLTGRKKIIAQIDSLDYVSASLASSSKGAGIASGAILENGSLDGKNKIWPGTFQGSATKSTPFNGDLTGREIFNFSVKVGNATGRARFTATDKKGVTTDWNGYLLKATFSTTGKRLGIIQETL